MTAPQTARALGEPTAATHGPEAEVFASADAAGLGAGAFASADAAGLGAATLAVLGRAAARPAATAAAGARYWASLALAGPVATARWLGVDAAPPVPGPDGDKRFADPAWNDNPAFFAIRQTHLAASRLIADLLAAGAGNPVDDAKAELALGFALDAAAPTNSLATNPAALRRALETGGASVAAGASTSPPTCCTTGAGRGRWTPGRSLSGRTWPPRRGRWCSGTT